ncbi:DNA-directed RNA polymerase subunit beta' [Striga asiatica]|uniref:DNA-directed RNA polymerase subunit beta n=1 Tax=Striga asiatica TaxID=4170 RepID=A0A5A7QKW9_STRAF|nr:DNA-directed RNA polymerase subunit beta' [Striga asiatica]
MGAGGFIGSHLCEMTMVERPVLAVDMHNGKMKHFLPSSLLDFHRFNLQKASRPVLFHTLDLSLRSTGGIFADLCGVIFSNGGNGVVVCPSSKNVVQSGSIVETLACDLLLEAAMRAIQFHGWSLRIEGPWKWILSEFADHYGVSDSYTKLRYLSYVLNVATPTKDCLELLHELLVPVLKARSERNLTRQEKSILLDCENQIERLLAEVFQSYKLLDEKSPTGLADMSAPISETAAPALTPAVQIYTFLHDILAQHAQTVLRNSLEVSPIKCCTLSIGPEMLEEEKKMLCGVSFTNGVASLMVLLFVHLSGMLFRNTWMRVINTARQQRQQPTNNYGLSRNLSIVHHRAINIPEDPNPDDNPVESDDEDHEPLISLTCPNTNNFITNVTWDLILAPKPIWKEAQFFVRSIAEWAISTLVVFALSKDNIKNDFWSNVLVFLLTMQGLPMINILVGFGLFDCTGCTIVIYFGLLTAIILAKHIPPWAAPLVTTVLKFGKQGLQESRARGYFDVMQIRCTTLLQRMRF